MRDFLLRAIQDLEDGNSHYWVGVHRSILFAALEYVEQMDASGFNGSRALNQVPWGRAVISLAEAVLQEKFS